VSFEEFECVEVIEPALKFVIFFRSFHRVCMEFRIEFAVSGPYKSPYSCPRSVES
jgi:hypothetical protein